jgi:hypothetical protein
LDSGGLSKKRLWPLPNHGEYDEILMVLEQVNATIAELEELPPSAKRAAALELLRSQFAAALERLRQISSNGHAN